MTTKKRLLFWFNVLSMIIMIHILSFHLAAQNIFQPLGDLPGGSFYSHSWGISDDGLTVVGESQGNQGNYRGFVWREGQGMIDLGAYGGFVERSIAYDVSDNGMTVVGVGRVGQDSGFVWTSASGITGIGDLPVPGGRLSGAYSISADGMTVVGRAWFSTLTTWGGYPIIWTQSGGLINLANLGGDYGHAYDVSGDGSVIVGTSEDSLYINRAFRWTQASGMVNLGGFVANQASYAYGVSKNGNFVVGRARDNGDKAFRWNSSQGMINLGVFAAGQYAEAWAVSNDGKVVGHCGNTAFVWTDSDSLRSLQDVLVQDYGVDLTGWTLTRATDISSDGRKIVGWGTNPIGDQEAYRVVLPAIAISQPSTGERWVVNKADTVRWSAPSVQLFNIDLSVDNGQTWQRIDFTTSPGDTMITYKVPDSLRTSDQCRIRIGNLNDSTIFSISQRFTIKGYDLTRIMPDSSLQNYDLTNQSWSYLNSSANMWPQTWWQLFDYANGNDPNTNDRYPPEWPNAPINARAQNMPDWPLFVEAFSIDQCYWSTSLSSYKASAEEYWRSKKGNFFGSCYGFAISSLLAFNYPSAFLNRNPGIAQADTINALFLTNTIRKGINREWAKQYAKEVLDNDAIGTSKTPRDLLNEVKQLFQDESNVGKALSFFNNNGSGAHTVLPYRLEHDQSQNNLWRLFVYDSNNPDQFNRFILIDSTANTWTDSTGSNWGTGNNRCYLEPSVSLFLQTLTFENASSSLETNPMMQLYTNIDNEIFIENSAGESIGYRDSSDFNTMGGAIAIIPKVGVVSPPIGYYLPENNYSVRLNEFTDSSVVVSAISDSVIYRYSRSDALFPQSDHLYIGSGLQTANPDGIAKNLELTAIVQIDSSERIITASQLNVNTNDSLSFYSNSNSQLNFANYGSAKTYNLHLSQTSSQSSSIFVNDNINLPANTTHLVSPVWNDLMQAVTIYVDNGNNGSIDDSLMLQNQVLGIEEGSLEIPKEFKLYQNYPNPFNPATKITFELNKSGIVKLEIFNVVGERIQTLLNEYKIKGKHTIQFDASGLSSGIYIYQIETLGIKKSGKMVLIK